MNILPFVFALLMVMGIMTYAKLDTFLLSNRLQSQYMCYMKAVSEQEISKSQKKLYDKATTERGPNHPSAQKVAAVSNLNFYGILHPKEENTYAQTQRIILKRLINNTYGNQPFFIEMQKHSQDLVEELFERISYVAQQPENQSKIERFENLGNLNLGSEKVQELFANILHGSSTSVEALKECDKKNTASLVAYPPLSQFVKIEKEKRPIRVFLVAPEVLLAIFNDRALVQEIIIERKLLHKQFKSEEKATFDERFRQRFASHLPSDLDPALFNFEVSGTAPRSKWSSS